MIEKVSNRRIDPKSSKSDVFRPPFLVIFRWKGTLLFDSKTPQSVNRCPKWSKTVQKGVQKRSKSDPFEFARNVKIGSKKNLSSEKSRLEKQEEMSGFFFAPETPKTKMTTSYMSIYYNGM